MLIIPKNTPQRRVSMHQAPRLFEYALIPSHPKPTRARKKKQTNSLSFLCSNLTWAVFQLPSVNVGYQMESGNDIVFFPLSPENSIELQKGKRRQNMMKEKKGSQMLGLMLLEERFLLLIKLCLSFPKNTPQRQVSMHQAPRLFEHELIPSNPKPTRARKNKQTNSLFFLGSNLTWAVFQLSSVNVGYQMESGNDIVFFHCLQKTVSNCKRGNDDQNMMKEKKKG
ncbi:hypothetical protein CEXT_393911 [Caerostris extrusa]|uniref:Uncharacterized protein n=1 Tax=Caerostris extrusa TaxID=172846 RepID=A0AAV4RKT3_CAEEX|nr:hypothetical protein CEXT_393911 [Caerostris extrusa]